MGMIIKIMSMVPVDLLIIGIVVIISVLGVGISIGLTMGLTWHWWEKQKFTSRILRENRRVV